MTVHVTRDGGAIDEFARYADRYIKHTDGSLQIVRVGSVQSKSYPAGCWVDVNGDEKLEGSKFFRHWIARTTAFFGFGNER